MPRIRLNVPLSGLVAMMAICVLAAQAQKIPDTHAKTLAGNVANLPADLHGKFGVLVLGFSKKSSDECHGWDDQISRDFGSNARTVYYEMPVLEDVPGMFRGMVVRGIRSGLTPAARARFLPVLQDETSWKKAAVFETGAGDDAYVLIVDETGTVKWRTHGAAAPAAYAAFRANLAMVEK